LVSDIASQPFLENRDAIRWVKDLATEFPRIRILVVSRQSERTYAERALCARASGIRAMLANKFIRFLKSMPGAANMVPRVATNNCDQALLANDGIADRHDPVRFFARAHWRG
jgi:DNA-binding NarL/FixJ family response regulator